MKVREERDNLRELLRQRHIALSDAQTDELRDRIQRMQKEDRELELLQKELEDLHEER